MFIIFLSSNSIIIDDAYTDSKKFSGTVLSVTVYSIRKFNYVLTKFFFKCEIEGMSEKEARITIKLF